MAASVPQATSERVAALTQWMDMARRLSLDWFQQPLAIDTKADGSPVTEADRAVEKCLQASIRAAFPDDGILGEEADELPGTSPWRWIIDPVDGTASFVLGLPMWGTLVGLEHQTEDGVRSIVAGVADFPALGERVTAHSTEVALWTRGAQSIPCRVAPTQPLSRATVATTASSYFVRAGCLRAWQSLGNSCASVRGWNDCLGPLLLATGRVDAIIEPVMHPWDIGPFAAILTAAGAQWADLNGRRCHLGGSLAAATSAELLRELRQACASG